MNRRCPRCNRITLRKRSRTNDVKCDVCGTIHPISVMEQEPLAAKPREQIAPIQSRTGLEEKAEWKNPLAKSNPEFDF